MKYKTWWNNDLAANIDGQREVEHAPWVTDEEREHVEPIVYFFNTSWLYTQDRHVFVGAKYDGIPRVVEAPLPW